MLCVRAYYSTCKYANTSSALACIGRPSPFRVTTKMTEPLSDGPFDPTVHLHVQKKNNRRMIAFLLLLSLVSFLYFLYIFGQTSSDGHLASEDQEAKGYAAAKVKGKAALETYIENLQDSIRKSRAEFDESMKDLYGESFFPFIFHRVNEAFVLHNVSKSRFLRRLNIKMLRSFLDPSLNETFTWVTGGHSNAAAHGNFYNQSYTATLERFARGAFQSVGLDFVAKNYAMGGYSSGVEISLCLESIYGQNFDLFSWDFGMTDGRDIFKLQLLINRVVTAADAWSKSSSDLNSYFPMVNVVGADNARHQALLSAEERGLGVFIIRPDPVLEDLKTNLPDASILDQRNLTEYLAHFVCGGAFESNDPCGNPDVKYRTAPCVNVKHQVSWHDGWKLHHLYGVLYADLMVQMLHESVDKLAELLSPSNFNGTNTTLLIDDNVDPLDILSRLQEEEGNDRTTFLTTSATETVNAAALGVVVERVGLETVARKRSLCRSALLPAQSRYDGIVTGSGNKKMYYEDFDSGNSLAEIRDAGPFSDRVGTETLPIPLPLAFDPTQRHPCEITLKIDYKDYFLVQGGVGWVSTVIPNSAEMVHFPKQVTDRISESSKGIERSSTFSTVSPNVGEGNNGYEGIIVICEELCDWGQCPENYANLADGFQIRNENVTDENPISITVNDMPVINVVHFVGNCYALEGEQNVLKWGQGNDSGQYELKLKVNDAAKDLHVSSFILL